MEGLISIATPIAAGLIATIAIWRLRHRRLHGWALTSIWLAVAAAIAPEVVPSSKELLAANSTTGGRPALLLVLRDVFAMNAVLQVADLVLWHTLIGTFGRHLVSRLLVNIGIVGALGATAAFSVSQYMSDANLGGLLITSTVVSAVIGLALQDVLSNVAAGIALQIESPFVRGDWVRMSDHEGEVTQINWRSLTLRTRENHHVVLTNSNVASGVIINFARPERAQAEDVYVGVAYWHPPEIVRSVLIQAAFGSAGVLNRPHPRAYVHKFDDSAVLYRVRFWVDNVAELPSIRDGVRTRIWYGLDRAGLTIPFPIRTVHMAHDAERREEKERSERHTAMFNALRPVELLAPLGEERLALLAEGAHLERFAPGESIVRQGADGETMYVVRSGRARVEVADDHGGTAVVARRGPGEYFGEMTLLTGEPRSASVLAELETEVVTLGRDAFAGILLAEPAVAETLSEVLTRRNMALGESLAEIESVADSGRPIAAVILDRIRSIFGLDEEPEVR